LDNRTGGSPVEEGELSFMGGAQKPGNPIGPMVKWKGFRGPVVSTRNKRDVKTYQKGHIGGVHGLLGKVKQP